MRPSCIGKAGKQELGHEQMRYLCGPRIPTRQPHAPDAPKAEYHELIACGETKRSGRTAVGKRRQ
jgi:hypothetical protein